MNLISILYKLRLDVFELLKKIKDADSCFHNKWTNDDYKSLINNKLNSYPNELRSIQIDQTTISKVEKLIEFIGVLLSILHESTPRSSAREWCLRTILLIDEIVLPFNMNEYLEKQIKLSESKA